MTLRKLLGGLGCLLPVILVARTAIAPDIVAFQSSISQYYYTPARDIFVCVLTSFGFFLFTYKGYTSKDNWLSSSAGVCALIVAFFPTSIGECEELTCRLHFISAALFFLLLSYIAYFLFTKSDKDEAACTKEKRVRNKIYRVCALTMVGCIILLALYFFWLEPRWPPTTAFWLESIALWAFGISWLVKGETILKDD